MIITQIYLGVIMVDIGINSTSWRQSSNNLFIHATTELSQDAFFSWLLSWLDHPEHELHECAVSFLKLLFESDGDTLQNDSSICDLNLKRQHHNIDIYFEITVNDEIVSFIIEDKVKTSHHSDQLNRYREFITNKNGPDRKLKCIYLKTGYIFSDDEKAHAHGYTILELKHLNDWISRFDVENDIFIDYKNYIVNTFNDRQRNLISALNDNNLKLLKMDYVQWEFLSQLYDKCPEFIGNREQYKGTNIGGTAWTQFRFIQINNVYTEGKEESIFYRIDKKKNRRTGTFDFYLAIRQYSDITASDDKGVKLSRLAKYREAFDRAEKSVNHPLILSNPRGDITGKKESEIAVLFFNHEVNTLDAVLRHIPRIHKPFVCQVKDIIET